MRVTSISMVHIFQEFITSSFKYLCVSVHIRSPRVILTIFVFLLALRALPLHRVAHCCMVLKHPGSSVATGRTLEARAPLSKTTWTAWEEYTPLSLPIATPPPQYNVKTWGWGRDQQNPPLYPWRTTSKFPHGVFLFGVITLLCYVFLLYK